MNTELDLKILQFFKSTPRATTPTKAYGKPAGIDIYAAYDYKIAPLTMEKVKTDLKVKLPKGTYGRIAARSGATIAEQIIIGGGVVDPDYAGDITILIFNLSNTDCIIKTGDSFAQLICEKISHPALVEVSNIPCTERGEKGFGSSQRNDKNEE